MALHGWPVVTLWLLLLGLTSFSPEATESLSGDDPVIDLEPAADPEASVGGFVEAVDRDTSQLEPFELLGATVAPGVFDTLKWPAVVSSMQFDVPVVVIHGKLVGPTVCITAALHGDELNGIEIARQVLYGLDPETVAGTVVAVPVVNMEGFFKQSRYIADRRDLNRYFPGNPKGITPERYAYHLFEQVIRHCDALIDLHTGSYFRSNLPQLRADMANPRVEKMVSYFGAMTVLHSAGNLGMLRIAATRAGIPAVTMEVGGPMALEPDEVDFGVKAIRTFFSEVGLTPRFIFTRKTQPVYFESEWVMADHSGILLNSVKLGQKVKSGDPLAMIINPTENQEHPVVAPFDGTVLGMAANQFVSEGFMLFRLGKQLTVEEMVDEAESQAAVSQGQSSLEESEEERVPPGVAEATSGEPEEQ